MAFNLNDFNPAEGEYVSKVLTPGTHKCSIIDLKLEKPPYDATQYNLIFVLEGPEQEEGFEGLQINRLNPSKGYYKGQIGYVKSSQYAYKDWVYKEKPISRDSSIQSFLGTFLKQVGLLEKVQAMNISADTIEEFVEEIKVVICKPEFVFNFTIAGQKYYKEGYDKPNYSLFFPKKIEGKYAFSSDENIDKLQVFDEAVHITERKSSEATDSSAVLTEGFTPAPVDDSLFRENAADLHLP